MIRTIFFYTLIFCFSINLCVGQRASSISPFLIGDTLSFSGTLRDMSNQKVSLSKLLKKAPTVLIFYRGGWCPYCNKHLSDLASIEKQVISLGFQLLAITPDPPQYIEATMHKQKLNYTLLSDVGGALIRFLGIAVAAPSRYQPFWGKRFQETIPTPAVYIVNQEKIIRFIHVNPNYKERLNSKVLLTVLQDLKSDG